MVILSWWANGSTKWGDFVNAERNAGPEKPNRKKVTIELKKPFMNYIGGVWKKAASGRCFGNVNPADTRQAIGIFPDSGSQDVNDAVQAAHDAFNAWRLMPPPKRGDLILRVGMLLEERKEELAQILTREMGKVLKEARGDVQEAIDTAYYIAGEGRRLFGQTTTSELRNKFAMSIRIPIGVCGIITPWNFPTAVPSWKLFPALISGNTVVFKPAEDTPASASLFVEIFDKVGFPKGVINMVHGGPETGELMVNHSGIHLISFTGSTEVGRIIAEKCGRELKKCSLEMGGKNAQIVMDDADLDLAVEAAVWGAFGTSGQRCTATSRLVVHQKVYDDFKNRLVSRAKKLRLGDGLKADTDVGPVINQVQQERIDSYVKIGVREGAKLECGGRIPKDKHLAHGFFYEPTVFSNVKSKMRIAQEEIFGPVTALIKVKDFDEAIRVVNDSTYGLSSSIFTRDVNRAMKAIRDIECGITYVNSSTIGAEVHLPFGGVKNTGNGHREAGETVIDIFTEWKTVYIDFSGKLQKAQIDTD